MMGHRRCTCLVLALGGAALIVAPAVAEDAARWTGEGSASAGTTSGNTDTTDVSLGWKASRDTQIWTFGVEAIAEFGENDGVENKNRLFFAGNADRQINDRLFGYGRASYERDEFSAYDSRTFVGGGLGYEILKDETATWSVRGGPGVRFDEVRGGGSEQNAALNLGSDYLRQVNDKVTFTNNTNALIADPSTQLQNTAALTAQVTERISARFSLDVRHDTDPQPGFEKTDTATRFSLVYAF